MNPTIRYRQSEIDDPDYALKNGAATNSAASLTSADLLGSDGTIDDEDSLEDELLGDRTKSNDGTYQPGEPAELTATRIREVLTAACLSQIAVSRSWSGLAWQKYCEQFLSDSGVSNDPIERLMIEELLFAHHSLIRMHVTAAHPQTPEQAEYVLMAIPRLLAEFRRLGLAIREYRSPMPTKVVNVVAQQNLAENQQVAYLAGDSDAPAGAPVQSVEKNMSNNELASKPTRALTHETTQQFIAKPKKSRGREAQPIQASRTKSRGTTAASRRRPEKPAVVTGHRTKDGRR